MNEWFYHPVTEWGKEIAEKHTRDDGIRIDVHEVLRKLEPIWITTQEKAEKLGDLSCYPEDKFGPMTVLDYFDLVELQADTYTERALKAEEKLRAIRDKLVFTPSYKSLEELSKEILKVLGEEDE